MTRNILKAAPTDTAQHANTTPISNSTNRGIVCFVNELPDKVLANIFVDVRLESWDDSWYQLLLHVCQRWAAVARASPVLWSTVSIQKEPKAELIRLSLQLSGALPLDISFIETENLSVSVSLISPHVSRLRSVRVVGVRATRDESLTTFLRQPMPNLKDLELCFIPKMEALPYLAFDDARPPEDLDPFLWNPEINRCPDLHRLSLGRGVQIAGQLPVYHALRQLELRDRRAHTPFTIVTFVQFLSQHPHLEELSLCQYRPAIVPVHAPLSLPHTIRKFSLEDNAHYVKPFLSSFHIPPTVDLYLTRALDYLDHGDIDMDDYDSETMHTVTQLLPDNRSLLPILGIVDSVELSREFEARYALTARTPEGTVVELTGKVHNDAEQELREGLHVLEDITNAFRTAPLVEIRVGGHGPRHAVGRASYAARGPADERAAVEEGPEVGLDGDGRPASCAAAEVAQLPVARVGQGGRDVLEGARALPPEQEVARLPAQGPALGPQVWLAQVEEWEQRARKPTAHGGVRHETAAPRR